MSSYTKIRNFGNNQPNAMNTNMPLIQCLSESMDHKFLNNSDSDKYGPRSRNCQDYMSQRCAENWDGYCEYFYRQYSASTAWPNQQVWPDQVAANMWSDQQVSTHNIGGQFLKNAGIAKYCNFPTCQAYTQPFDPMNPDSPKITYYRDQNGTGCVPVCRVNPATIDGDVIMNHMLENPMVSSDVLLNICNTAQREGIDLSGTKIGRFCTNYQQLKK